MNDAHLADVVVRGGLQTGPFGSQLKASEYVAVGVPVVMPKDIRGGRICLDSVARVSNAKAASLQRHRLRGGDILFARRGDLAKIALIGPNQDGWLCGTGCLRARVDAGRVEPRFVLQYLALPRMAHWLQSNALGQTMLNLNTETVGQLLIPLPSLDEQRRIADILATWDTAIEKTERLIQTVRVEIIEIVWTAAAQSDGTHIRLGDICIISRGKGLSKGNISSDGARPCILYGELHTKYGEVVTEVHSRTHALTTTCSQQGDVLVPSSSETHEDLANATALNKDGVLLGGDISILRPQRSGEYCAEYLAYYLRHIKRRDIARLAQGNAIVHLYGRELARLNISLPDVERQFYVAAALRLREREITLLRQLATAYGRQKAGLMQVLLGASDRKSL